MSNDCHLARVHFGWYLIVASKMLFRGAMPALLRLAEKGLRIGPLVFENLTLRAPCRNVFTPTPFIRTGTP